MRKLKRVSCDLRGLKRDEVGSLPFVGRVGRRPGWGSPQARLPVWLPHPTGLRPATHARAKLVADPTRGRDKNRGRARFHMQSPCREAPKVGTADLVPRINQTIAAAFAHPTSARSRRPCRTQRQVRAGTAYFGARRSPCSQRPRPLDFIGSSYTARVFCTRLQIAHSNVCKSTPGRASSIQTSIIGALHLGQAGRSIATNGMTDDRR